MDSINNDSMEGFGGVGLPLGFGMTLAMNERAMTGYAGLTEAQKEDIILRAKDAKSKEEMERIVSSLVPSDEEGIKDLFK